MMANQLVNISEWTNGLSAMIDVARRYSKRTPAVAVNTCAYVVACIAAAKTPTVPVGRIDSELAVEVVPRLGKRGKPLSIKSAKNRNYAANGVGSGRDPYAGVPLSWLIISARAKAGSNYNRITASHWMMPKHPLAGVKRSKFARIMEDVLGRMVRSRHSSTSFLKSAWLPAIRMLEASPLVSRSALRGHTERAPKGKKQGIPGIGWAVLAVAGQEQAQSEIANAAGTNTGDALAVRHNTALHRYGGPALAAAMEAEFWNTVRYVDREESKAFLPLRNQGWIVEI